MDPIKLVCALYDSRQKILRVAADFDGNRKFVEAGIPTKAHLLPYVLTSVFDNQHYRKAETPIEKTIEFVRDSLKAHSPKSKTKPFAKRTKKDQRRAVLQTWSVARWHQGERDGIRFALHGSGNPCGEEIDRSVCQLLFREAGDNLWLGETPQFPVYLNEEPFREHANRPSRELALRQLIRSVRSAFPSTSRFVSISTHEKNGKPDFEINRVTYPLKVLESSLSKGQGESDQVARLRDQHSTSSSSLLDKALTRWLEGQSRVLILSGGPGTGKTWSMAVAASRFLEHYECNSDSPIALFPFCARVADIAQYLDSSRTDASASLQEAILRVFEARVGFDCSDQGLAGVTRNLAHELIHSGRIILLLDAWDECSATLEPVVLRALKGFLNDPDKQASRIILSSRNADQLKHAFPFPTIFEILSVECATNSEIAKFVEIWFGGNEPKSKEALSHLLGTPTAKDLFKVPLLAAIILWLYEFEGVVPSVQNRSDLLRQTILAVLKLAARDAHDHPPRIIRARAGDIAHDIFKVLAKLAYETFDGQAWSITSEQFTNALKSDPTMSVLGDLSEVLEALTGRFGIFSRSPADGSLSVIHQTFAEYLAARHVHTVYGTNTSTFRMWIAQHAGTHLLDPRWKETWCYLAFQTDFPEVLLEEIDRLHLNAATDHEWPRDDILNSALCLAGSIRSVAKVPPTLDKNRGAMITRLIKQALSNQEKTYNSSGYRAALVSLIRSGELGIVRSLFAKGESFGLTLSARIMDQLGSVEHKVILEMLQSGELKGENLVEVVTLLNRFPEYREGALHALENQLDRTEDRKEQRSIVCAIGCVCAPDHTCNALLLALSSHKDKNIKNWARQAIADITECRRLYEKINSHRYFEMDHCRLDALLQDREIAQRFVDYDEFSSVNSTERQRVKERLLELLLYSVSAQQGFAALALHYMGEADSIATAILEKMVESGTFRERVEATRIKLIRGVPQPEGERLLVKLLDAAKDYTERERVFSIVRGSVYAEHILRHLSKEFHPSPDIFDCAVRHLLDKLSAAALVNYEDIIFSVLFNSPDPFARQTVARVLVRSAAGNRELLQRYIGRLEGRWECEGALCFLSAWADSAWAHPQGHGRELAELLLRLCREFPCKMCEFCSLLEYCDGLDYDSLKTLVFTLDSLRPEDSTMYATAAKLAVKYRIAVFLWPDPRIGMHEVREPDSEELPTDRLLTFSSKRLNCKILELKPCPLAEAKAFPALDEIDRNSKEL